MDAKRGTDGVPAKAADHSRRLPMWLPISVAAAAICLPTATFAQTQPSSGEVAQLREMIEALRAEQARSAQKIADLETALAKVSEQTAPRPAALAAAPPKRDLVDASRFDFSGDLRVRYENNFGDNDAPGRSRAVFRARLRAAYAVNNWLSVGGQLVTGDASRKGDLRLTYGYAETDVDAVLAAFSHDNTSIATNYVQHSFGIDFVPADNIVLNATLFHYRPKNPIYAGGNQPEDWLDRMRLNFLINF